MRISSETFLRIVCISKIFTVQLKFFKLGLDEYFELNQMFPQIAKFYNYDLFIVIAGVHQGLAHLLAQAGLTF